MASPGEFAHELNVARPADAEMRIEAAVIRSGGDSGASIGRRVGEVRVVECIEEAGPEFKSEALSESESPLNGNVPSVQARSNDRIARASAECSGKRLRERALRRVRHREILQLIVNRAYAIETLVEVAHAALVRKGQEGRSQPSAQGSGS